MKTRLAYLAVASSALMLAAIVPGSAIAQEEKAGSLLSGNLPPVGVEPAGRDSSDLPGRLAVRPARQGGSGRAHGVAHLAGRHHRPHL